MSQILRQKFGIQINQLFRTAGLPMSMTQVEQLQAISDKIVDMIEEVAKERAVELIRKMQEAVGAGFTAIGKDIDAVEARLDKLDDTTADGGSIKADKKRKAPVPPTPTSVRPLTAAERDAGFTSEND